jgi:uncharacterized protein YlbG (UPF0298 family)
MVKRKSLIVHFRSPKAIKQIEQLTPITYFHKKRRYAVVYVNEPNQEELVNKLQSLKLVKRVEESLFETTEYDIDFDVK